MGPGRPAGAPSGGLGLWRRVAGRAPKCWAPAEEEQSHGGGGWIWLSQKSWLSLAGWVLSPLPAAMPSLCPGPTSVESLAAALCSLLCKVLVLSADARLV